MRKTRKRKRARKKARKRNIGRPLIGKHGVGMIFAPWIWRTVIYIEQKGARLVIAKINTSTSQTCISNTYKPQIGT